MEYFQYLYIDLFGGSSYGNHAIYSQSQSIAKGIKRRSALRTAHAWRLRRCNVGARFLDSILFELGRGGARMLENPLRMEAQVASEWQTLSQEQQGHTNVRNKNGERLCRIMKMHVGLHRRGAVEHNPWLALKIRALYIIYVYMSMVT